VFSTGDGDQDQGNALAGKQKKPPILTSPVHRSVQIPVPPDAAVDKIVEKPPGR
jgi:hypothetical protein